MEEMQQQTSQGQDQDRRLERALQVTVFASDMEKSANETPPKLLF